jgi:CBS domain-containing protein
MTVGRIMSSPPLSLRPTDTVGAAAQGLIEYRFVNLPVADENGRYLGLFGVFEMLALILPRAALEEGAVVDLGFIKEDAKALKDRLESVRALAVGDHINRSAPVLRPETPLLEAMLELYRARSTLAVVEEVDHRLVGMVSYWDALSALMSRR